MFERIVAAVDADPERSVKVLDAAEQLALGFHSHLLVVHVRELERPTAMIATTARPGAAPPSLHLETEEAARALVDDALDRLRGAGVAAEGRVGSGEGTTARELLEIAQSYGASVIIVGDRGSRVTDLLLGSVAHRIVHLAPCPVLLVR
jgi:nucleotide-binding universal stress UspA family protein